jgi:hypothetical protein
MGKLYKYFRAIGLTEKNNLILLGIMYGLVFIGSILCLNMIDDFPKELGWICILFPFIFIMAVLASFYINTFFEYFHEKLSSSLFILFCIFVYIIWTGICAIVFTKIGINNKLLLFSGLLIIGSVDAFLIYKFLWNIQIENDPNKKMPTLTMFGETIVTFMILDMKKAVKVMIINFILLVLLIVFLETINLKEIIRSITENKYFEIYIAILFIHYTLYCLFSIKFNRIVLFNLIRRIKYGKK